jgi:hypothetical protein
MDYPELLSLVKAKLKAYKIRKPALPFIFNQFLRDDQKLPEGVVGQVQWRRWMKGKTEPRASITLAMLAFIRATPDLISTYYADWCSKHMKTQQMIENTRERIRPTSVEQILIRQYISSVQKHTQKSVTH